MANLAASPVPHQTAAVSGWIRGTKRVPWLLGLFRAGVGAVPGRAGVFGVFGRTGVDILDAAWRGQKNNNMGSGFLLFALGVSLKVIQAPNVSGYTLPAINQFYLDQG